METRILLFVGAAAFAACGGHGTRIGRVDGGNIDADGGAAFEADALLLPVPAGCEDVQFTGNIRVDKVSRRFADALQEALRYASRGQPFGIGVDGASDTKGLECFDGLVDEVAFAVCSGPLHITSFPRGATGVYVDKSCTVAELSGIAGVANVEISDASLVTDFSALKEAQDVMIFGDMPLESIAPYVQDVPTLEMGVTATSLAPLNNAKAHFLLVWAKGLHSLSDYVPSPTMTCFDIKLDASATAEEWAATEFLCTAERSGRQCGMNYNCCWPADCGPMCPPNRRSCS